MRPVKAVTSQIRILRLIAGGSAKWSRCGEFGPVRHWRAGIEEPKSRTGW